MTLFKRVELWANWPSWCHPNEWRFYITKSCSNGCISVDIGFFGFTIFRGNCVGMQR